MIRTGKISAALLVLLLLPTVASAQRDTRETREAAKFIGLAMTRSDEAERAGMYVQAMDQLRPAMTADAENARVWLLAGTALAALGELREADEAFDRAVALHPAYAEEISTERESAWVDAFNRGIRMMEEARYEEAIAEMEGAQAIFAERPEALLNLGALYSNAGDYDKAIQALQDAITATAGPMFDALDSDSQAEWLRYQLLATANVAQILAQQGIDDFNAEQYDSAAARFLRAAEANPHARDYWFNYAQALWASTTPLEEALPTASKADSVRIEAELAELYAGIRRGGQKAREFDPNNEVIFLMEARTHRMEGEFNGGANRQTAQTAALRILEAHDVLPVLLEEVVAMTNGEGTASIAGKLKNAKLAAGATVTIRFTLFSIDGAVVSEHDVSVAAPAVDETTTFESLATTTGDVAGWKYVIVQ